MFFGSQADVSTLIQDLQKDLLLKVTGTLNEGQSSSFLGRNLKRTSTFISVGMSPSYIDAMLELYGLKQCRPALAPGTDALRKQLDCEPLDPEDHKRYRRAVGQLLWLSSVRTDIMYAVKELSRGLSAPTTEHEAKVKHLLKYLAGTKHFEQKLQPTLSLSPQHKAIDIKFMLIVTGPGATTPAGLLQEFPSLCSVRIYFRTAGPRPLWPSRAERQNFMRLGLGPQTHFL